MKYRASQSARAQPVTLVAGELADVGQVEKVAVPRGAAGQVGDRDRDLHHPEEFPGRGRGW